MEFTNKKSCGCTTFREKTLSILKILLVQRCDFIGDYVSLLFNACKTLGGIGICHFIQNLLFGMPSVLICGKKTKIR
jgi:hypothetical protein